MAKAAASDPFAALEQDGADPFASLESSPDPFASLEAQADPAPAAPATRSIFDRLREVDDTTDPKTKADLYSEALAQYEVDRERYKKIVSESMGQGRAASRKTRKDPETDKSIALYDAGLYGIDFSSPKNYLRTRLGEPAKTGLRGALEDFGTALATSDVGQTIGSVAPMLVPVLREKSAWRKDYEKGLQDRKQKAEEIFRARRPNSPRISVSPEDLVAADKALGKEGADWSSFDSWVKTVAKAPEDASAPSAREQYQADIADELASAATPSPANILAGASRKIGIDPSKAGGPGEQVRAMGEWLQNGQNRYTLFRALQESGDLPDDMRVPEGGDEQAALQKFEKWISGPSVSEMIGQIPASIGSKRFLRGLSDPRELAASIASSGVLRGTSALASTVRKSRNSVKAAARQVSRGQKSLTGIRRAQAAAVEAGKDAIAKRLDDAAAKMDDLLKQGRGSEALVEAQKVEKLRKGFRSKGVAAAEFAGEVANAAPAWTADAVGQAALSQGLAGEEITPAGIVSEMATGLVLGGPTALLDASTSKGFRDRADRRRAAKQTPLPQRAAPLDNTQRIPPVDPAIRPAELGGPGTPLGIGMQETPVARQQPDGTITVEPTSDGGWQRALETSEAENNLIRSLEESRAIEQAPMREQLERNRIAQAVEPLGIEADLRSRSEQTDATDGARQARTMALDYKAPELADMRQDIAARQEAGYKQAPQARPEAPAAPEPEPIAERVRKGRQKMADPDAAKRIATQDRDKAKVAKKAEADAKRRIAAVIGVAKEETRAGRPEVAKTVMEAAKKDFELAYPDKELRALETRKAELLLESSQPKARKPPKEDRSKSVAEANARVEDAAAQVRRATTVDEVDGILEASAGAITDASRASRNSITNIANHRKQLIAQGVVAPQGRTTRKGEKKYVDMPLPQAEIPYAKEIQADAAAKARIEQRGMERLIPDEGRVGSGAIVPRAPAPSAPAPAPKPSAPAAKPAPLSRRKISAGGRSLEIPGLDDLRDTPGHATKEFIDAMVSRVTKSAEAYLSANVRKLFEHSAPEGLEAKLVDNVHDYLRKAFPPARVEKIELLQKRELVEAEGDAAALQEFDLENGLLQPNKDGGGLKVETLSKNALTNAELVYMNQLFDLMEEVSTKVPTAPKIGGRGASVALDSMMGFQFENALTAAMNGLKRALPVGEAIMEAFEPISNEISRIARQLRDNPNAKDRHLRAMRDIGNLVHGVVSKNHRIAAGLRSRVATAAARYGVNPFNSADTMALVRDNIEGKIPDDALTTDQRLFRDEVRAVLDELRDRNLSITGSVGRDGYFPRVVDRVMMQKIREVFSHLDAKAFDDFDAQSNSALGKLSDTDERYRKISRTLDSMTEDMLKLFSIRKSPTGKSFVEFTGNEADIPGIFTMRPQLEDGTFAPGLLQELFEDVKHSASYAGTEGQVKPRTLALGEMTPEQAKAEMRQVLRGANLRALAHSWDPESPKEAPVSAVRSRTWQLDGSLTSRRMMPDMGADVYLPPMQALEQAIERQTAGLSRLEMFGKRRYDDYGNYLGYDHKGTLNELMETLSEVMPDAKVGMATDPNGTRRLANHKDDKAYKRSLLRSVEDAAMGYMRPFTENNLAYMAAREVAALATLVSLTMRTGAVVQNEISGPALAASKFGGRTVPRLLARRAQVASQQLAGAIRKQFLQTIGSVGSESWRAHMRDMASTDVLEVMRSTGMSENLSPIHQTKVEKATGAIANVVGTFGKSVDGMSLAYHLYAQDLFHGALAEMKRDAAKPGRRIGRMKQAAAKYGGTGDYAVIDQIRELLPDADIARAMQLVDENGTPSSEAALAELVELGMPFAMDAKSFSSGMSNVLNRPKVYRNRWASWAGWMMGTVISLTARHMEDVAAQKTKSAKVVQLGRKALYGGAMGGAAFLSAGAMPMGAKIAAAAINGSLLPMTGLALAASMGYEGSGDERRRFTANEFFRQLQDGQRGDPSFLASAIVSGLPMKPGLLLPVGDPASEGARAVSGMKEFQSSSKISDVSMGPLSFFDRGADVVDQAWWGGLPAGLAAIPTVAEAFGGSSEFGRGPSQRELAAANKRKAKKDRSQEAMVEGYQQANVPALVDFKVDANIRKTMADAEAMQQ